MNHMERHNQSWFRVLFSDNSNEFFKVDSSISVPISIIDHLVNLLGAKSLTHTFANFFKIFRTEATTSTNIKSLIELLETSFRLIFIVAEDIEESLEIKFIFSWGGLDDIENIFGLVIHIESSDGVDKLINRDLTTVVIIKDVENLFHLDYGINWHIFWGIFFWLESLNKDECTLDIWYIFIDK